MQFSFELFTQKRSSSVLMNRNKYVSPVQTNVCLIIHGICQFYVFPFFNNMLVFNNGLSMISINKICRYFANAPLAAHVHLFCFAYKELNINTAISGLVFMHRKFQYPYCDVLLDMGC